MSKRTLRFNFLGLIFLALTIQNADAGIVLYDNGVTQPNAAYFSDIGSSSQFIADDFFLAQQSRIETVFWSGIYGDSIQPDNFSIEFMVDTDPDPSIFTMGTIYKLVPNSITRIDTGDTLLGLPYFTYAADITPDAVILDGSQQMWLTVINNTNGGRWSHAADSTSGRLIFDGDGRDSIGTFGGSLDFRLEGTAVPEPGCWLAPTAVLLIQRRKKRD